jgi:hypothetical protein
MAEAEKAAKEKEERRQEILIAAQVAEKMRAQRKAKVVPREMEPV